MNTGIDIYYELERRGLTHSRRHASRELFGAADNYLSLCGDRGPSTQMMIRLFRSLYSAYPLFATRIAWLILFGGPEE